MSGPRYPRNWASLTDAQKMTYLVRKARRLAEHELRITSTPEWKKLLVILFELEIRAAMEEADGLRAAEAEVLLLGLAAGEAREAQW